MAALDPAAIRARAHQIWIRKGKRQGHSVEDWAAPTGDSFNPPPAAPWLFTG